eukprot:14635037-Alexandrium_andersonii.AAC.1
MLSTRLSPVPAMAKAPPGRERHRHRAKDLAAADPAWRLSLPSPLGRKTSCLRCALHTHQTKH